MDEWPGRHYQNGSDDFLVGSVDVSVWSSHPELHYKPQQINEKLQSLVPI